MLFLHSEKYKNALNYCGQHSGRDGDKFKAAKLDVEAPKADGIAAPAAGADAVDEKAVVAAIAVALREKK